MDYSYVTNIANVILNENGVALENSNDVNSSAILQLDSHVLEGANKILPEGLCIDMSQLSIVTSNGIISFVTAPSAENPISSSAHVDSSLNVVNTGNIETPF